MTEKAANERMEVLNQRILKLNPNNKIFEITIPTGHI